MNFDLPTQRFVDYIPLIERYLLAEDKQKFINSLPKQGNQSMFLQLFTSNLNWETYQGLLQKLGLSYGDKASLQKLQSANILLGNEASNEDREKAIELVVRELRLRFDHAKPTNAASNVQQNDNTAKLESQLKIENYSLEKYLQLNNFEGAFSNVTELGLLQISKDRILNLKHKDFNYAIDKINLACLGDKALDILKQYFQVNIKQSKNFTLSNDIYKRLTLDQLQKLPKYIEGVVNSREYILWRYKKGIGYQMKTEFPESNNKLYSKDQLKHKKELLKRAIDWLKNFKLSSVQSFIDHLTIQLLTINILIEETDLDVFTEYIKRPRNVVSFFSESHRKILNSRQNYSFETYWYDAHDLNRNLWPIDAELIQNYLNVYFKHNSDLDKGKQFEKYFTVDFINKALYRVRLEKGENTADLHKVFSKEEEADLKNKKQLTISDKNKKKFGVKDNISLELLVKNIFQITAEIYEISTQKHFLSSSNEIDGSISLQFLEPLKKVTHKVGNQNPYQVTEVEFNLTEHLGARNSIFIINFQGDGILSRAVIRRGSIVAITRPTLAGIQLRFFDEDGTAIQQLDIWLRGRKIHVKEKYTIPYGQSRQSLNLIAVKDEYAELIRVSVEEESYNWEVSYTYHEQNFLVGSKAKILLHSQLNSNSGAISTQVIKDTAIIVNIINHLNIPSSLSFTGIKWDYKNEYELEIPVQAYLKSINISVTAKVDKYVGKPQQLSSNKTITFRDESGTLNFVEFFLSSTTQGYILNLLGKNGEPKPYISVNINVFSNLYSNSLSFTLITDKNGQIKLGKLKDIKSISVNNVATSDIQTTNASWNFEGISRQVAFSNRIIQREGDEFYLPAYSGLKIENEVFLLKINQNSHDVISNQTYRLKLEDNRLHASLPKGLYKLKLLPLSRQIQIWVTKLDQWGSSEQMIDNQTRTLYSIPTLSKDPIFLPNKFERKQDGDSHKIFIKLQAKDKKNLQNVRVHILASTFTYRNDYSSQIVTSKPQASEYTRLELPENRSTYLNNKELSDEHCYILNRQKQDKFIGNNLERPRVLLKRTFNRDTTVKKEELASEKSFRHIDQLERKDKKRPSQDLYDARSSVTRSVQRQGISLFNNFLKNPSLIIPNQHGQIIEFSLPKHYQSFVVILASPRFAVEKLYTLDPIAIETNNLASTGLREANTKEAFTISRQFYKLQKGETLSVKRSSQWASVSGSNITILSEINRSNLFEWATKWPSYSEEKKLQVYDEYVCHELNTYIKYADPQFFKRVVKPFIFNKLEKGVVDYCLIGDKQAEKYAELEYYNKLNPFEKCLIVEHLIANNQSEKAKSISQALALEYKSLKVPYSQFQNKFDIVMTSKQIAEPSASGSASMGSRARMMKNEAKECFLQRSDILCSLKMKCEAPKKMQKSMKKKMALDAREDDDEGDFEQEIKERKKFTPGFKEVQKTKQYVETTYYEMKQPESSTYHIPLTKFWVDLAEYFVNPKNSFLTESFIYLTSRQQLSLAIGFLPLPLAAQYNIKAQSEDVIITAQSPFIVFVKEIKSMDFTNKYGVLINQRVSDPQDEFEYEEDGTRLQKHVGQYIKDKPYYLQTVVTNTSTANLQLQILIDIPEGSIPLGSNEYTQVTSQNIGSYETRSFKNGFYFPQAGQFNLYPANASKNRQVISKANLLENIVVKDERSVKKLETLNDVLVSGSNQDILNFLKTKNIFDRNTFNVNSILWLLKEKEMFQQVFRIFKSRSYYSRNIYEFGFLHKDKEAIRQFLQGDLRQTPFCQRVFEYYPLTSQRVHKFMKAEKSTILNETFKKTYEKFLIDSLATRSIESSLFLIVFTYYLILQDRVKEATEVFTSLSKLKNEKNFPAVQYDYVACFLDMYIGYPNFATARNISSSYVDQNYPVETWRKLFKEVNDLLNVHDVTVYEEERNEEHDIKITVKNNKLSVFLPQKTTVEINFHAVNLELMFSNSPFDDAKLFSTIKPFKSVIVTSEKGGEQFVQRPEGYFNIYVHPVELSSTKQGQVLPSFLWASDAVKVKLLQDEGVAVVFVDGKPKPGVYCKVYARGNETRFYKDGYTDIQGRFKYVSQLDDVKKFSLLFVTEKGGITKFARIPSKNGTIS